MVDVGSISLAVCRDPIVAKLDFSTADFLVRGTVLILEMKMLF